MRAALLLVLLLGCEKTSAKYCELHGADHPDECPAPDASGGRCDDNAGCGGSTPACATDTHTCVACVDDSTCAGKTPVCTPQRACTACTKNADCASGACLPDGSCAAESDIAFVDGNPSGPTSPECTKQMPCTTLTTALATTKSVIRVHNAVDDAATIDNRADTFVLGDPTASISHNSSALLTISGTSNVVIRDLVLGQASGANTIGIQLASGASGTTDIEHCTIEHNDQGGIRAESGKLIVNRSQVFSNQQGGIIVRSGVTAFAIRNSFITDNGKSGGGASSAGGVLIETDANGHVEFNSIVANQNGGTSGIRAGLQCTGTTNSAGANLVAQNISGLSSTDGNQLGGTCDFGSTVHLGDASSLALVSLTSAPPDPHLTAQSPGTVHDAAGACGSEIGPDIDGDARPQGTACDIGADELR